VIAYLILTATLAGSTGWCLGHRTARIRHIPIGALPSEDDAAFTADEHTRFNQLITSLDDDPQATP
jgi:hypothetical protein